MSLVNGFNSRSPTVKRIMQESREMSRNPDPSLTASPLEDNLFEWHFTIVGPPSSPYEKGIYHGRIILPPSYPLRPPMFRFMTPSGRFEVNREICLSISGHHEETWQPAWGIRTALCAIRAFMESEAKGQVGGLDASEAARRRIAAESRSWKCATCGDRTTEDIMKECRQRWEEAGATEVTDQHSGGASQIPSELRLAYRDELDAEKGGHSRQDSQSNSNPEGNAPVRTSTETRPNQSSGVAIHTGSEHMMSGALHPPSIEPATGSSMITARRVNNDVPGSLQTSRAEQRPIYAGRQVIVQRESADGVPAWMDKLIVAVAICFVLMVMKKIGF